MILLSWKGFSFQLNKIFPGPPMHADSIALNARAIPSGPELNQKRRSPRQICRGLRNWCGREDSNFHGLSPTATSTLRVYQFRHDRSIDGRRYQIATTHARTALLTRSAFFAAYSRTPLWARARSSGGKRPDQSPDFVTFSVMETPRCSPTTITSPRAMSLLLA